MAVKKIYAINDESYSPSRVGIDTDLYGSSAFFSAMAYRSPEKIADRLTSYGALKVVTYTIDDLQAFFSEFEDFAVVSFRGIMDNKYKSLLRFWKAEYCGELVHAGFAESICKLAPSILNDLKHIDNPKKLLYTGHSFGGAMSLLLSLSHKPDVICTIGSPKIGGGNSLFKRFADIDVHRIQTCRDIVTFLPPCVPKILDYWHVGKLINLDGVSHPYESHRLDVYLRDILRSSE